MAVSKYKNFFIQNFYELVLFILFILYFSLWIKFNYSTTNLNNNDFHKHYEKLLVSIDQTDTLIGYFSKKI